MQSLEHGGQHAGPWWVQSRHSMQGEVPPRPTRRTPNRFTLSKLSKMAASVMQKQFRGLATQARAPQRLRCVRAFATAAPAVDEKLNVKHQLLAAVAGTNRGVLLTSSQRDEVAAIVSRLEGHAAQGLTSAQVQEMLQVGGLGWVHHMQALGRGALEHRRLALLVHCAPHAAQPSSLPGCSSLRKRGGRGWWP